MKSELSTLTQNKAKVSRKAKTRAVVIAFFNVVKYHVLSPTLKIVCLS